MLQTSRETVLFLLFAFFCHGSDLSDNVREADDNVLNATR